MGKNTVQIGLQWGIGEEGMNFSFVKALGAVK
jgi:hypothetical protein